MEKSLNLSELQSSLRTKSSLSKLKCAANSSHVIFIRKESARIIHSRKYVSFSDLQNVFKNVEEMGHFFGSSLSIPVFVGAFPWRNRKLICDVCVAVRQRDRWSSLLTQHHVSVAAATILLLEIEYS